MNFDYILKVDLPLDEAWETLMDIERIAPCMPGATIESKDGDDYVGRLKVKLGPMEMTYRGNIHFIERDDEAKTAIVDAAAKEIKGRGAAKTQVKLHGNEAGDGSEITIASEFTVSGKAAQFGRGVMEEVGEKLMNEFAARLGQQIGAVSPSPAPVDSTLSIGSEQPPSTDTESPAPASVSTENEALNIGEAAWWPVLRRLAIPAGVLAIIIFAYLAL
ncbi:MAG: carbon monoxide dehydrogenase subunit G [Gammaproteobacteria bacterium]|jgi:carbon monoxide dehydrogenase subunit G